VTTPMIPRLERPDFVPLQRLEPDDLEALFDYQRELRWLHNRSLHAWGVASGYVVEGGVGAREVRVAAGYAIDIDGREVLLATSMTLPVPPVASGAGGAPARFHLTASYIEDGDEPIADSRAGVCGPGGTVRRLEAPRLRFQDPLAWGAPETRFRPGLDLVLASIEVSGCVLSAAPSFADRVSARPPLTPHIAGGVTTDGNTPWQFALIGPSMVGVETTVDTSDAAFARAPLYTVQLLGQRVLAPRAGTTDGVLIDGVTSIQQARASSFVLRVTLPRDQFVPGYKLNPSSSFTTATLDALRTTLRWRVAWMGIEP